jgi:hypothetical protein
VVVPFFLKRFSEWFVSQKWCQMEPQMASKNSQNLIKNELETKPAKHVENVLNLIPLDLQETRFRIEKLAKITKTRGADKSNKIQNMCRNGLKIHENSASELNKKRCLKTELNKLKNSQKVIPKWLQKTEFMLGEIPLGAPLVVQTVFVMKKLAPSAPKVRPRTKKLQK